jgi:hypothetical protein
MGADLGGDGEARRHRQSQIAHLGQVRALAAEQILHGGLVLGLTVAERINPLAHDDLACAFRAVPPDLGCLASRRA